VLVDNVLAIVVTVVGLVDVEGVVAELDTLVGKVLVIVEVMLEVEPADVDAVFELVGRVEVILLDEIEVPVVGLVDTVPVVDANGVVLAKVEIKILVLCCIINKKKSLFLFLQSNTIFCTYF
jgi:hypothetical protein